MSIEAEEELPKGCVPFEVFWSLSGKSRREYRDRVYAALGKIPKLYLAPSTEACRIMNFAEEERSKGASPKFKITYPDAVSGDDFRAASKGKKKT